jgi:peptidoglycan/xylan/chitin deacetylase (PgdA/CDA1 family)
MGFYTVKTPWILKRLYPGCTWSIDTGEKIIYLSFDDGPHPVATPYVLETLASFKAKATFFCLAKNVLMYPEIYSMLIEEGHRVGNHTFRHLNGWNVTDKEYFDDVQEAALHIDSKLFRPPYGKISAFQIRHLKSSPLNYKIIMWDILSADFDEKLSPKQCSFNVTRYAKNGSIVVFHDSEKAFPRMKEALSDTLIYFSEKGFRFELMPELAE